MPQKKRVAKPQPVSAPAQQPHQQTSSHSDAKTLALLAHILALLFGFLGPLIMMLASEDPLVKRHAKRALNWQFSLMIYMFVSLIMFIALMIVLIGFIFIPVMIALSIMNLVFCIIAAVRASNNEIYSYPLSIRFFHED